MRKFILVAIFFFLVFSSAFAQGWKTFPNRTKSNQDVVGKEGVVSDSVPADQHFQPSVVPGNFSLHVSPEIIQLDEQLKKANKENPKINGFTLVIFSESGANSRNMARTKQIEFTENFPQYPTHLNWKNPSYEITVGDFRTKLEAEKALREIKEKYPSGFIRADKIDLPLLEPKIVD